jgi:Ca2+-binding RTX toxin-like protein
LNSAAAIVETVDLGTGNDTVTIAQNLADTDIISGGDGTDTIAGTSGAFVALTTLVAASNNISGFEGVRTTDALDQAIVIASDVQSTGITSFTTPGSNANDNAAVTMAAGDMTVNLSASLAGTLTITDTGTATTDSVTINNTALVADDMGEAEAITINGYETATIVANSVGGATSQDFAGLTMAVDTGGASVLNITGNSPMTTTGTTGIATIDASGMTGEGVGTATLTMTGVGTGATTITGSPGRDTLLAANTATTLNGGAGNDVLTGGTAGDTINGGDGIDTINTGAGALATTVDTIDGGAGNDVITVGQGTSTIGGGAGDDSINMVGTLSTGDVVTGGEGTDTIRLNASPTAATAGQVSGFERVQLDLSGGTVNFATMGANAGFTTATASAATTTFSNATATVAQLELDGGATTLVTFSRLVDGTTDTLDIETTAAQTIADLSIIHEEIVTIDAADGAFTISTAFTNTDMTSLTASGDNAVDLGTSTGVSIATIDASAMTAQFTAIAATSVVAMTVSGPATAAGIITSGAGADTVTGGSGADNFTTGNGADIVSLGAGNDTVNTGAGNDTITNTSGTGAITGGIGADTFTGGTGIETYVQAVTSSVAPSAFSIAAGIGGQLAAGDSLTFANGVDLINGFSTTAGALDIVNGVTTTAPTTAIGQGTVLGNDLANGADDNLFISGAWDANSKTFTFTADGLGADTLYIDATNGAVENISTHTGLIVMVGVDSDNLAAANFA